MMYFQKSKIGGKKKKQPERKKAYLDSVEMAREIVVIRLSLLQGAEK